MPLALMFLRTTWRRRGGTEWWRKKTKLLRIMAWYVRLSAAEARLKAKTRRRDFFREVAKQG
jgi:hypothetical protein